MAQLGSVFNAHDIPEDDRNFDPIPAGDYLVQAIDSELRVKENGDELLKFTFEILDGPFQGRRLWENLNVKHSNPTAQSIAQRSLADLILAVGLANGECSDSEQLHFKPVVAKVKIDPPKNGYDASNKISRYRPMNGAPPAQKAPAQARQEAPATAPAARANGATQARPWGRG
jgi:hypothetical protein